MAQASGSSGTAFAVLMTRVEVYLAASVRATHELGKDYLGGIGRLADGWADLDGARYLVNSLSSDVRRAPEASRELAWPPPIKLRAWH